MATQESVPRTTLSSTLAEVEEKWFTVKDNLPKHSKEKDKYNK